MLTLTNPLEKKNIKISNESSKTAKKSHHTNFGVYLHSKVEVLEGNFFPIATIVTTGPTQMTIIKHTSNLTFCKI